MITFAEWLGRFDEESREERLAREREAAERQRRYNHYLDKSEEIGAKRPNAPVGSPEWLAHARQMPESPRDDFTYEVEAEIFKLTGKSLLRGAIIDPINGGDKIEADKDRVYDLLDDSYDDGTSPQEAARMMVDLMKSMGHLK